MTRDLTLPRYYYIKNCILLTRAIGNWNDAELYRLAAEQAYSTALSNAQLRKDQNSLDALEDLREDLDVLITCKTADFKEFADHNDIESERDKHTVGPLVIHSKKDAVD